MPGAGRVETTPRVVVIDDDASLRATVRITLAAQGWDVTEAADPDSGVAAVQRVKPDIVLLDVNFPGDVRDGFAVCRELRSLPATKSIPIVLFTANGDPDSRAFASAVGASAFLVKPFGAVELQRFLKVVKGTSGTSPALGVYLVDAGVITPQQLERALAEQRLRQGPRVPLGRIVSELGYATHSEIESALMKQRRAREAPPGGGGSLSNARRVVIADDHDRVREGLRSAIAAEEGFSVVGLASDGDEALRLARLLEPDVIVLDHDMPRRTGLEILPTLHAEFPQTGVVMFTLDEGVREKALALGAAAVVTKDQSLDLLIAEVRRASKGRQIKAVVEPGVVLAARGVAHRALGVLLRRRRALFALGIIAVCYAGAFLLAEPALGASAGVFAFASVAIAGALLGLEWGLVAGLLISALTTLLWTVTGHQVGEPVATIGGNGVGVLAIIGVGAGFGAMRMLRGRFDREGRQANAIADAAIFLASASGPEVLRAVAAGAREAVSGDCVLIFLPVPGTGALELVASRGAPPASIGARRVGQAVARAQETGQTFVTDAGAASIGVEVPRMRSAVVAPLGAASTGGVLAVLSSRRDAYSAEHVSTLAAYAAFSGLTLQAHLRVAAAEVALADSPGFRARDRIIR